MHIGKAMTQITEDTYTELKLENWNILTEHGREAKHNINGSLLSLGLAWGIVLSLINMKKFVK